MAKTLKEASEAELLAELERKKKAREAGERPRPLTSIEIQNLIEVCDAHVEELDKNGYADDDSSHYIYEAAMTAIYGPNIFKWINKKTG